MKRLRGGVIVALALGARLGAQPATDTAGGSSAARTDAQARSEVEVTLPVYRGLAARVGWDLRLARIRENGQSQGELGLLYPYRAGRHVTITPRYRLLWADEFESGQEREHRPVLEVVLRASLGRFDLRDDNVHEWRFRESGDERRFRNRLRVEHPVPGLRAATGFVSAEAYLEDGYTYTRNRLSAGMVRELGDRVTLEGYYMRQDARRDDTRVSHILGLEVEVDLRRRRTRAEP